SLDVGKAIDKRRDERHEEALKVTREIAGRAKELGISRRDINLKINDADNSGGSAQSWTTTSSAGAHKPRVPEWDQWVRLRELLNLNDPDLDAEVWRLNGRKGTPGEAWEKREVVGAGKSGKTYGMGGLRGVETSTGSFDLTAPATSEAQRWDGWGTALKPAIEPIILARKPLDGTVANNVLAHGVGGLNIDACRIGTTETLGRAKAGWGSKAVGADDYGQFNSIGITKEGGRFPANVLLDEHAAKEMDKQSGWQKDGTAVMRNRKNSEANPSGIYSSHVREAESDQTFGSGGGASRFFPVFKYQAKAPKRERPVIEREDGSKIQHATVKPLALMEWLVSLIVPPGGVVLDPFAGSGTTLEAARNKNFRAIGIEQDADYIKLINKRLGR